MTYEIRLDSDRGSREPLAKLPSLRAAQYAAAMIARERGEVVRVYNEDGDDLHSYGQSAAEWIPGIVRADQLERIEAARDRLTTVLDEAKRLNQSAAVLRRLEEKRAAEIEATIDRLLSIETIRTTIPHDCRRIAAEACMHLYKDSWTVTLSRHVSTHEGDPIEEDAPEPIATAAD